MEKGKNSVKLYHKPKLRAPYLLAAWSGMGAVALLTVNYLRQALHAELFGEIDPWDYYAPSQVLTQDGLIQSPVLPETRFYFWDKGKAHDLIFLIGTVQPSSAYEMAVQIMDTAAQFAVERVYTAAAFPKVIHHTSKPRVLGAATHRHMLAELEDYDITLMQDGTIDGLNGLLLAAAKVRDIRGLCLLGEIPLYAHDIINPWAAHAVLRVLTQILDVDISLKRLEFWAKDMEPEMDRLYDILPDKDKEAFKRSQGTSDHPHANSPNLEQPLIADEAFFEGIEQFLDQHRHSEDDTAD